jgi:2-octaprenyl-6-methoxyphenol hydroxylase
VTQSKYEIAVVGGGLAGYATAIGLATEGLSTVLVAPPPQRPDGRSTALIGPSVAFLDQIGVLSAVRAAAEAMTSMRIVDDTKRLLRAPTLTFEAEEIGLAAFGFNILNADLLAILHARALELGSRLTLVGTAAERLDVEGDDAVLRLADGARIKAALVVGADGRGSLVREQAGIGLRHWSYPQSAIVLNFAHARAHGGTSTEFHTPTGPFTQVPLPGRMSSLVWVETPETAALVVDLPRDRLEQKIEAHLHSILGAVSVNGSVQRFPLSGASAEHMAGRRVALVGEAAHVFPPIGAQGLNLGLRDAAAIVAAAAANRDDPGRPEALRRYEASRRGDVVSRTLGVDILNRSLLAGYLPAQAARTLGLSAMAAIPLLRRFAMREGVSPGAGVFGMPRSVSKGIGGKDAY